MKAPLNLAVSHMTLQTIIQDIWVCCIILISALKRNVTKCNAKNSYRYDSIFFLHMGTRNAIFGSYELLVSQVKVLR